MKSLVLWVTTDCNLRCRYCYAEGGESRDYMSWPVAEGALDAVKRDGESCTIQFAGGEPILNLDLVERVVHYTRGWDVRYQMQTNATLVDAQVARKLKDLRIAVGVSLDGPPAVNDALRPFSDGRGSTLAVLAGLNYLADYGLRVGVTCVVSAASVAGLPSLVDLASHTGVVEGIALDVVRPMGRAGSGLGGLPSPDTIAHYLSLTLERAELLARLGGSGVKFREVERLRRLLSTGGRRRHRCFFDAASSLAVTPGGDAYPCASLVSVPDFYLGNVTTEGFGEGLRQRLRDARDRIVPLQTCLACDDIALCGGPCPAHTFAWRLKGVESEGDCAIRRTVIDYVKRSNVIAEDGGPPWGSCTSRNTEGMRSFPTVNQRRSM